MGVLHKYIFKQVFWSAFFTVALFVFVLVLGNVIKEVMGDLTSGRIDFFFFLYIVALLIPGVIPYALPLGMLTGILLVFGRMSSQSEIVAMKASGRSLYDISAPVFFLAILASVFSVGINFYYAPLADYTYKSALKNLIRDNPLRFIQAGNFVKDFPGYVIYANSSEGKELKGFRIWELNNKNEAQNVIYAKTGTLRYNDETDEIELTLKDVSGERRRDVDAMDFSKPIPTIKAEEAIVKLPLNKIFGGINKTKHKLSLLTFGELMNARHTWKRSEGINNPESDFKHRIEVQLTIQKNFAMAFSIFSMVILAIPLGIKASRTETFVNLGIALALSLSYYLMIVIISWFEKFPYMRPDVLIWIPNLIFLFLGYFLFIKSSKN